jgi:MATE family multidrug resistance protein
MRVEMCNNLFCVVVNIPLTYCFVFGKLGLPEWGLTGAVITTVFCLWLRFLIYVFLMFVRDWKSNKFHVANGMRLGFPLMRRLLYFGFPAGLYTSFDTVMFTAFVMMIGGLGQAARDASTIAFTLNSFTYIPLMGIGIVVTSMVGNQLGKNRPDLARRATITATIIGCGYAGFFGFIFLVLPELFLIPFILFGISADVYNMSITLLLFVALYLFFDTCAVIFMAALRGAGDTIFIAWAVGILAPLMPIFCAIGIYGFGFGIIWCWSVLTGLVLAYCIVFWLRYRNKVWESMRVIEKEII